MYTNKTEDPQEILRRAEVEAEVWADAQKMIPNPGPIDNPSSDWLSAEASRVCLIDGAWSLEDQFTGQGWFCRKNGGTEKMMGAMSLRRSLSALHAECEVLIWAMECMKALNYSDVIFATGCSQLVKMVSSPGEWPVFTTHLEEFQRSKTFFPNFTIRHIPRAQNQVADKLARGDRCSLSAMFYVDSMPPAWFSESGVHTS